MDNNHSQDNFKEIEAHINCLFTPSQSIANITQANNYLFSFIQLDNFSILKRLLATSISPNSKIYVAQALIELITKYYLSLPPKELEDIYSYVITYLFTSSEYLTEASSKCLLNVLIKLLCRLVRVNWLTIPSIRSIHHDVICNAKEEFISSLMMPFPIFTELIYQFQCFDLPPKHKVKKIIHDFKETALLPIFDYSIQEIIALFQHDIKTEKIDDMFTFIDEVVKCLLECLEYEDDLNAKEDFYAKYEIKPAYIPNNKKRSRDKSLDIEMIENLFQSLFDIHNLRIKSGSKYTSEQCLRFLQKLIAMKIVYLGDKKYFILKLYQNGICNILFNKNGYVQHEQLCKLIYSSKKNYSVNDLMMNEHYLNYLFTFTQETLSEHFIECLNGFIYLLRFFAYISFGVERITYMMKSTIKTFVVSLLSSIIAKSQEVVNCDEDKVSDLIKTFGLCGYCCYEQMMQIVNDSISLEGEAELNAMLLQYGVSLMKAKYLLFSETKLVNKTTENETMIDSIHLTELIPTEVAVTVSFILNGFSLIQSFRSKQLPSRFIVNIASLAIIKLFSQYFLSQHLPNKYIYIYQQLTQLLHLSDNGEIVTVLIDSLVFYCQQGAIELKKTIKIIQIIEANCLIDNERGFNPSKVQLGKLYLTSEFIPHIQQLINVIVVINPSDKGKTRKLLLASVFNLYSMVITYEEALSQFLSQFNFEKILNDDNEVVYAVNSLSALIAAVKKRKCFEVLIEKIVPLIELLACCFVKQSTPNSIMLHILKLFNDLTSNSSSRISFKPNSDCPYKLFRLLKELLSHYHSIAKTISITNEKERYQSQIKPVSLFSRLFDNVFNGEFIQISVIVSAEPVSVQLLFKSIMELITSLSHEDVFGYLKKFKSIYRVIKTVYIDYPKCSEASNDIICNVLLLFKEGIDSNDKDIVDLVYASIFDWGLTYLSLMKMPNKASKEYEDYPNRATALIVFEKHSEEMTGLLLKLFQILLNNEFEHLESMSKAILVLGLIYYDYYLKMALDLVEVSRLIIDEKKTMNEAFVALFSSAISANSISGSFLVEVFMEELKQFGQKIKEIYNNHCNMK